jgi:hypothetical protein
MLLHGHHIYNKEYLYQQAPEGAEVQIMQQAHYQGIGAESEQDGCAQNLYG